jgi:hypothetical protein
MDLNPPLIYLLTRLSFHFFHPSTLACRLPEIVAFFVATLCLQLFIARRAGHLYGLFAAALLFSSFVGGFSIEARPYSLLLGSLCASLLGWQRAHDHRPVGIWLIFCGALGMLLSHVFGILPWAVIAVAEGVDSFRRKSFELKLAAAWMIPLLSVVLYLPMLRNHAAAAFPPAFQPTLATVFYFYLVYLYRAVASLAFTGAAVFLLDGRRRLEGNAGWYLSTPEWLATSGLTICPIVLIAYLRHVKGAFFFRYGMIASVGISILCAILLCCWSNKGRRAALLGTVFSLLLSGQAGAALSGISHWQQLKSPEPVVAHCEVCELTASIDPSIPLVDASGLTFLEMSAREGSADLDRIYYLTDPVASLQYAHATIFERMQEEADTFHLRSHVSAFHTFIKQHPHFFVFGQSDYPEDWLLRKLSADGAHIVLRGHVASQYKDNDVYEITF